LLLSKHATQVVLSSRQVLVWHGQAWDALCGAQHHSAGVVIGGTAIGSASCGRAAPPGPWFVWCRGPAEQSLEVIVTCYPISSKVIATRLLCLASGLWRRLIVVAGSPSIRKLTLVALKYETQPYQEHVRSPQPQPCTADSGTAILSIPNEGHVKALGRLVTQMMCLKYKQSRLGQLGPSKGRALWS